MKIINLIGAPGIGKSKTGEILGGLLSLSGYSVEFVPEFAKFATFAGHEAALQDQIYMFAKQQNRLHVLKSHALDFVLMDGPLIQQLAYAPEDYFEHYERLVVEVFNSYDNLNFFLQRNPEIAYQQIGRKESPEESEVKQRKIEVILAKHRIPHHKMFVDMSLPTKLLQAITGRAISPELVSAVLGLKSARKPT